MIASILSSSSSKCRFPGVHQLQLDVSLFYFLDPLVVPPSFHFVPSCCVCFDFSLIWIWFLVGRTDVLHRTSELVALSLNLNRWSFHQDCRGGWVWRHAALWQAASKPVRFSGSCQTAHYWKAWTSAQSFLSCGYYEVEPRNSQT